MTPQLYVFAGPNGAGKSSFSGLMLGPGIPVFDGDKEFAKLKKTFDSTDSGTLYDAVNGHILTSGNNHNSTRKQIALLKPIFARPK